MSEVDSAEPKPVPPLAPAVTGLDVKIAADLPERTRVEGVSLVGQGGLLYQVTRRCRRPRWRLRWPSSSGMNAVRRRPAGSRSGSSAKTVRTEIGQVRLDVPRDRVGTFEPKIVATHARRVGGFDEAIISLHAQRSTTREIQAHLGEIYGVDVSRDLISKVTDKVVDEMKA